MGIVTRAEEAKKIADAILAIKQVLEALNPDRAVVLEVDNLTDQPLRFVSHEHTHGGFAEPPSIQIPPAHVDVFGAKDASVAHGTEGKVTYESDAGFLLIVEWNNPVVGSPSCKATVLGSHSNEFEALGLAGVGEIAQMKFTVHPGVTHPPPVRKGSVTAGAVREVAVVNNGPRGVITAVRAGNETLRLISWEVANDGMSISRLAENGAGKASDIDIARGRLFVTACRAENKTFC